jgi:hypothetical protein
MLATRISSFFLLMAILLTVPLAAPDATGAIRGTVLDSTGGSIAFELLRPGDYFFHRGHEFLGHIFNDWRISTVVNYGTGRPFNATVSGDPNQDGNDLNDRLPGYSRNAFTGPDYATTDLRLTRTLRFGERYKLNLIAESFNLLNRDNRPVAITSNGMVASATTFVQNFVTANIAPYPGYYQLPNNFMKPEPPTPRDKSS